MILYKIIQIVRALWLAIKPFYMSVCKHSFRSSSISYFIKEILNDFRVYIAWCKHGNHFTFLHWSSHIYNYTHEHTFKSPKKLYLTFFPADCLVNLKNYYKQQAKSSEWARHQWEHILYVTPTLLAIGRCTRKKKTNHSKCLPFGKSF